MALRDVIEEVRQEIAAAGSGINEADAKAALITPILSELGWRGLQRIRFEYPVEQGRMRLDYALIGSADKPVALIEAKAPRENLDSHVEQVLNYAFREGVDICVLTTGTLWWLYLPREKVSLTERRFAELDMQGEDTTGIVKTLESCLGYEALTNGSGEKHAKEMLAARQLEQQIRAEIPRTWRRLISDPDQLLVDLVREAVAEEIGSTPTVEQVADFLRHEKIANSSGIQEAVNVSGARRSTPTMRSRPALGGRPSDPLSSQSSRAVDLESDSQTAEISYERSNTKRPSRSVRGFRLGGEFHAVISWTDLWNRLAGEMYEQVGNEDMFLEKIARSQMLQGPSRDFFSRSTEGMFRPYKVRDSGIWMECNFSSDSIAKRCLELMQVFGRPRADFEIVDE